MTRRRPKTTFDRKFYSFIERVASHKSRCSETSAAFEQAERDLNEGLGLIHSQFRNLLRQSSLFHRVAKLEVQTNTLTLKRR